MVSAQKTVKSSVVGRLQTRDSATEYLPTFETKNIELIYKKATAKILTYYSWSDEEMRDLVVANFGDTYLFGDSIPNFPAAGT